MYKLGTKIYIENAGNGANGANGREGIVIGNSVIAEHGLFDNEPHFNVKLSNGSIWAVSPVGIYTVIKEKKGKNMFKSKCKNTDSEVTIENVIHYDPVTIIVWSDGSVTRAKCQDGETYDKEKGFLVCVGKKFFGTNSKLNRVLNKCCN